MSGRRALSVLVVDDEFLARQRLEDLLRRTDRVTEVRTAESGAAAVEAIGERRPDLVFLDMQMPGMSGLDVVRTVGPRAMPVTIFVTAHDQYAVDAFEVAALDYLLKPFEDERFTQAFERALRQLELADVGAAAGRLVDLLEPRPGTEVPSAGPGRMRGRIAVESGGTVELVAVEEISHVTAAGPYVELHTKERKYLMRETMGRLEARLEAEGFFRIHRSSLVRLDRVSAVERASGGDYSVRLAGGEELSVSRARMGELERRLGVER